MDSLDYKNTFFEEKVGAILNSMAPMKCTQIRKNYRNWVDAELKAACLIEITVAKLPGPLILFRTGHNTGVKGIIAPNCFMTKKIPTCLIYLIHTKQKMAWPTHLPPNRGGGDLTRKPEVIVNILQDLFTDKIKNLMGKITKNGRDPLEFKKNAMNRWEGRPNFPTFNLR